jgi:hypothetical protein
MDIPTTDFVRAGSLEELKAKGRLVVHGPHRPSGAISLAHFERCFPNSPINCFFAERHATDHQADLMPGSRSLLGRRPAPTALNRRDDLNSIRRVGHRSRLYTSHLVRG